MFTIAAHLYLSSIVTAFPTLRRGVYTGTCIAEENSRFATLSDTIPWCLYHTVFQMFTIVAAHPTSLRGTHTGTYFVEKSRSVSQPPINRHVCAIPIPRRVSPRGRHTLLYPTRINDTICGTFPNHVALAGGVLLGPGREFVNVFVRHPLSAE